MITRGVRVSLAADRRWHFLLRLTIGCRGFYPSAFACCFYSCRYTGSMGYLGPGILIGCCIVLVVTLFVDECLPYGRVYSASDDAPAVVTCIVYQLFRTTSSTNCPVLPSCRVSCHPTFCYVASLSHSINRNAYATCLLDHLSH